jgi:antitoxin component of RelBE/YafQ-DinJ toxin-antitoxin module
MKKTELLQIRIDDELLTSLSKLAESNGLSISSQVRMLIKKGVDNAKG